MTAGSGLRSVLCISSSPEIGLFPGHPVYWRGAPVAVKDDGAGMSVKLIDNDAFYGFRVRRAVNGRLYQEYFSLKKGGKRMGVRQIRGVEKLAQARDHQLFLEQQKSKQRRKGELCFHPDGRVKGISYLVKTEKSGTRTPIFQIGIASQLEGKVVCTSYSINAHGAEGAWRKAVNTYAKHKKISRNSKLHQRLMAAIPEAAQAAPEGTRQASIPADRSPARQRRPRAVAGQPRRRAATGVSGRKVLKKAPADDVA